MATIKYKGEEKEVILDNKCLMKFEQAGGSFNEFETKPWSTSVTLMCSALGLEGNPADHANDLPPLKDLSDVLQQALDESGLTGEVGEEENGST